MQSKSFEYQSFGSFELTGTYGKSVVLLSILLFVMAVGDAMAADTPGYNINPGDKLLISVWKEEGLSIEVLVTPDGNCTFPLIGQIKAAGRTVEVVAQELVQGLKHPSRTR